MIDSIVLGIFVSALVLITLYFLYRIPFFLGIAFLLFATSGISAMYIQIPMLTNSTAILQFAPQYPIALLSAILAILCVVFFYLDVFR